MRIVILGGGTVGTSIADLLCRNKHRVTVVDNDPVHTRRINDELDVRVVTGSASRSSVLFQADCIGADFCLAVTGDDEVNIVSASLAKAMGARRVIARVYAPVFRDLSTFDYQRHFGIDRLLSLEHLSAMELARGIRSPRSVTLEHFARGELEVQEVLISEETPALNTPLRRLTLPRSVRIGSIYREGHIWIAGADDVLQLQDRITLIGSHEGVEEVKDAIAREKGPRQTIVIAGGGETGYHLARSLKSSRYRVVVMEQSRGRCEYLANHLDHVTVVQADATRRSVLEEERVAGVDYFVACIGDDENNIMSGVEARDIGAQHVMAIVSRPDYANLVGKLGIDRAVSPRDVMARQVLGFLNTGPVVSRSPMMGGSVNVLEIEVQPGVPATQFDLANLPLPRQCLIAALVRGEFARVPHADDRLQAGDTVVALIDHEVIDEALASFRSHGR